MPRLRRCLATGTGEQLGNVGGVEGVALVAELTIDHHAATLLGQQQFGIGLAEADQGTGRALTRAAAAELQRLLVEQAHVLFMVEAMQQGRVVQAEQLFGSQCVGQGQYVVPALGAFFRFGLMVRRQLLQQQACLLYTSPSPRDRG